MKFFGISRNVFFLGLVSLLNDASSEMIYPLVPLFLTQVLGASLVTVGLIEGIAESTASLLKTFSGYLSDKIGRRKGLTVVGYSLSAISKPILAVATSPFHVLLVRFSDRVGKGHSDWPAGCFGFTFLQRPRAWKILWFSSGDGYSRWGDRTTFGFWFTNYFEQ